MKKPQRIDKIISNFGITNRSNITMSWLRRNSVSADGKPITSPKFKTFPENILVKGEPLEYPSLLYLAVHKPRGYICTRSFDELTHDSQLVYQLFPEDFQKRRPPLQLGGRLDKWASGLVLASQDGVFLQKTISPKTKTLLGKDYIVQLKRSFTGMEPEIFASGSLKLESERIPCRPALFEILDESSLTAKITLFEGRYHQVRRMIAAVGNSIVSIYRTRIGPILLEQPSSTEHNTLTQGEWRHLTQKEIQTILSLNTKFSANSERDYEERFCDQDQIVRRQIYELNPSLREKEKELEKHKKELESLKEKKFDRFKETPSIDDLYL